jgi:hypothetical protein
MFEKFVDAGHLHEATKLAYREELYEKLVEPKRRFLLE